MDTKKSEARNKFIKDTSIYIISDFISLFTSTFLVVPIFTKTLSLDDYSIYSISTNGISLITFIFVFGIPSATGVLFIEYKKNNRVQELVSTAAIIQVVYSTVLLLAFIAIPFLKMILWQEQDIKYYYISLIISYLSFLSQYLAIVYRYNLQARKFFYLQLFGTVVNIFALVHFCFRSEKDAFSALFVGGITNICVSIYSAFFLIKEFHITPFAVTKNSTARIIYCATPFLFSYICYFLSNKSFILFLQKYCELSVIGVFHLLFQIGGVVTIASNSLAKALSPLIYDIEKTEAYEKKVNNINDVLIEILAFGSFGVFAISKEAVYLFSKPEYYRQNVCAILILGAFFANTSFVAAQVILANRKFKYTNGVSFFSGIMTLILGFLFISRFGILGASLSYCLTQLFVFLINMFLANRLLKRKLRFPLFSILLLSLSAFVIVFDNRLIMKILLLIISTAGFGFYEIKKMNKLELIQFRRLKND